jgi:hypothetical protein
MQQNSKHNIPAFSIVEAMVSMVLTAIIIGLVFGIFTIVSEQLYNFKEQNQYTSDFNRLSYSMNKSIFESDKMIQSENAIIFLGYNGDSVVFIKNEDYILRSHKTFKDTFQLKVSEMIIDSVYNTNRSKVFQKIAFDVLLNEQKIPLHFYKPVYANQLINSDQKQ